VYRQTMMRGVKLSERKKVKNSENS